MKQNSDSKVRCTRCDGLLTRIIDYAGAELRKIEVIKCLVCGHRMAERPYTGDTAVALPSPKPQKGEPMTSNNDHQKSTSNAEKVTKEAICADCGQLQILRARKLCVSCYNQHHRAGTLDQFAKGNIRPRVSQGDRGTPPCADCGRAGLKIVTRGLCVTCHRKNKAAGTLDQFEAGKPGRKFNRQQAAKPADPPPAQTAETPPVQESTVKRDYPSEPLSWERPDSVSVPAATPAQTVETNHQVASLAAQAESIVGVLQIESRQGVVIFFDDQRDSQLLERLLEDAHVARRSVDQQILYLVEKQLGTK